MPLQASLRSPAGCACSSRGKGKFVHPLVRSLPRPPGCECPRRVLVDKSGNILTLRTCPVCTQVALDSLRGAEYAKAHVKCGDAVKDVLLKQKEFFSLEQCYSPRMKQRRDSPQEE